MYIEFFKSLLGQSSFAYTSLVFALMKKDYEATPSDTNEFYIKQNTVLKKRILVSRLV